jgi:hydrogenase maturation factor HypF (carbamoyltransferase family)
LLDLRYNIKNLSDGIEITTDNRALSLSLNNPPKDIKIDRIRVEIIDDRKSLLVQSGGKFFRLIDAKKAQYNHPMPLIAQKNIITKHFNVTDYELNLLKKYAVVLEKKTDQFDFLSELNSITTYLSDTPTYTFAPSSENNGTSMPPLSLPIVKSIENSTFFISRPEYRLGFGTNKKILAFGAESKNTICFASKDCTISGSNGLINTLESVQSLTTLADGYVKKFGMPDVVATDLHPEYIPSSVAQDFAKKNSVPLVKIQHHKAHIAAVAAEHNLKNYVGIAADGLGYGDDSAIWGGEVFSVEDKTFTRIGHLEYQPLLGGDSAILKPSKMLFGILQNVDDNVLPEFFSTDEIEVYSNMLSQKFNIFKTSSAGRIFDAASALLNICNKMAYPGRPALLLESKSTTPLNIDPIIETKNDISILNTTELFRFLLNNRTQAEGHLAATVPAYIAKGLHKIAASEATNRSVPIVFSGEVAYNKIFSSILLSKGALPPKNIPPGDNGLSAGQAFIADNLTR